MKLIPDKRFWAGIALSALIVFPSMAGAAEAKMEARLVWGTNDEKSPNPDHKKLDEALTKKLKTLPFKWNNFFEVNRKPFNLTTNYTRLDMSKQCSIDVKDNGKSGIKVKMFGQGKEVTRIERTLPKGEILTIGGENKNDSAWLVIIKRIE